MQKIHSSHRIEAFTPPCPPAVVHIKAQTKTAGVFQKILKSTPAKFLNQKPSNFFVKKAAGSATFLSVVFIGGVYVTPYGLMGAILLSPVLKQVAYRTTAIAGNVFSHVIMTAVEIVLCNSKEIKSKSVFQRFKSRMKVSLDSEIHPFSVHVLGAVAGEAAWAVFINTLCPIEMGGVTKEAVKTLVAFPFKQVSKAASQYGYNRIFGTISKKPSDCFSMKDVFEDVTGDCAAVAASDYGSAWSGCSKVGKFFLYMGGKDLGTRAGLATWEFYSPKRKEKVE